MAKNVTHDGAPHARPGGVGNSQFELTDPAHGSTGRAGLTRATTAGSGKHGILASAMTKGKMIVLDGGNGAGKSTVLAAIERHLRERGLDPVMTREPGGTRIGEAIRDILLSRETPEMCDTSELLLFAAARAQHLQEKILPALAEGRVVISDRFDSATLSFQHYARGLPLELVNRVNDIAICGFRPEMTIVLDLDPATGLARVKSRGDTPDRLETEHLSFLQRARQGYLEQARANPSAFHVIDASKPLEDVIAAATAQVDSTLDL